jgi:hypothetical protein
VKVVPNREKLSLIKSYHGGEGANDWGRDRTVAAMRRDGYYWNGQWGM